MLSFFVSRSYRLRNRFNEAQSLKGLLASSDGLRCNSPELVVEIVTVLGDTTTLRFVCDTGSDHMVIPIYVARLRGIPYRKDFPGTLGSSVGGSSRCYFDYVQVRSSLSGRTHRWICAFADSLQARLLVGRSGFLDDFAVAVTGRRLVVSRSVSMRRFLRHHADRLHARFRSGDEWEPI